MSLSKYEIGFQNVIKKSKVMFRNNQYIATYPEELICLLYQDVEGDWITIRDDIELYDSIIEMRQTQKKESITLKLGHIGSKKNSSYGSFKVRISSLHTF